MGRISSNEDTIVGSPPVHHSARNARKLKTSIDRRGFSYILSRYSCEDLMNPAQIVVRFLLVDADRDRAAPPKTGFQDFIRKEGNVAHCPSEDFA